MTQNTTKKQCFVAGSVAYDSIFHHPNLFTQSILAEHLDRLNVAFLVPKMERHYGGCAGNIVYGLNLLNQNHAIDIKTVATVGRDGDEYLHYLKQKNISTEYIQQIQDAYTAQALIITDAAQNQITSFHPGAMEFADQNPIPFEDAQNTNSKIAIIAPDSKNAMLVHIEQLAQANISCIFDPGQMLPTFQADELFNIIDQVDYVITNAYEANLLSEVMKKPLEEIAQQLKALIVTQAEHPTWVYLHGETGLIVKHFVPTAIAQKVVDPTGCGDAFRAGLLYGLLNDYNILDACALGNIMGSHKIATAGGQNYKISLEQLKTEMHALMYQPS
jgi:adenosine kinase